MRITVWDAEYDAEEFDGATDAQVIETGILIVTGPDEKPHRMYAPGAWREVEFDREGE